METGAIANFLKNSMQELFAGVRGAVAAPRDYVPAIVPVPVSDVNNQFASGTETYKAADDIKKKETKEEKKRGGVYFKRFFKDIVFQEL